MFFHCHGYVRINIMVDKDCYFNLSYTKSRYTPYKLYMACIAFLVSYEIFSCFFGTKILYPFGSGLSGLGFIS